MLRICEEHLIVEVVGMSAAHHRHQGLPPGERFAVHELFALHTRFERARVSDVIQKFVEIFDTSLCLFKDSPGFVVGPQVFATVATERVSLKVRSRQTALGQSRGQGSKPFELKDKCLQISFQFDFSSFVHQHSQL